MEVVPQHPKGHKFLIPPQSVRVSEWWTTSCSILHVRNMPIWSCELVLCGPYLLKKRYEGLKSSVVFESSRPWSKCMSYSELLVALDLRPFLFTVVGCTNPKAKEPHTIVGVRLKIIFKLLVLEVTVLEIIQRAKQFTCHNALWAECKLMRSVETGNN